LNSIIKEASLLWWGFFYLAESPKAKAESEYRIQLQAASHKPQAASCKLQAASCKLQAASKYTSALHIAVLFLVNSSTG